MSRLQRARGFTIAMSASAVTAGLVLMVGTGSVSILRDGLLQRGVQGPAFLQGAGPGNGLLQDDSSLQEGGLFQGAGPLDGTGPLQGAGPFLGAGPLEGSMPLL